MITGNATLDVRKWGCDAGALVHISFDAKAPESVGILNYALYSISAFPSVK